MAPITVIPVSLDALNVKHKDLATANGINPHPNAKANSKDVAPAVAPEYLTKARNNNMARLLACLVNEGWGNAYIAPHAPVGATTSSPSGRWMLIASSLTTPPPAQSLETCLWVPLRNMPVVQQNSDSEWPRVTLLDQNEFAFPVYRTSKVTHPADATEPMEAVLDSIEALKMMQKWHNWSQPEVDQLASQLASSIRNQAVAYTRRSPLPQLGKATAMDWELSLVEGHPTHPMNLALHAVDPLPPLHDVTPLLRPTLRFCVVPRDEVIVCGEFEKTLAPLLIDAIYDRENEVAVPVHEVQLPNVLSRFPNARLLDVAVPATAQSSIRTVVPDTLPSISLKLPLGIVMCTSLRTLSKYSAYQGPALVPFLHNVIDDPDLLLPVDEFASCLPRHPSNAVAKHMTCVLRRDVDTLVAPRGEIALTAAALIERDVDEQYVLTKVFNLDTFTKRKAWLQRYIQLAIKAYISPLKYGVAFEGHLQNSLPRFKRCPETGEWVLVGFAYRDFGGIEVHAPTLRETTGLTLDVLDEKAFVFSEKMSSLYSLVFHALFQCHLHLIIRASDMHYNGEGWRMVREELEATLPRDSDIYRHYLQSPTADWKCYIGMKLQGAEIDIMYSKITNLIVYDRPSDELAEQQDDAHVYTVSR
ncbi:uncharacterized protein VTP21DRAFT_8742 [Calcarisporiella thermophila]|uniref:uncharacterized protein n=1 Tax=Calcarisporiella thermophila TaxID=911321 RepID=UPI003744405F